MPLYEVAIIEQPTPKDRENGASESLVLGPVAVIAKDPQAAAINAVLDGKLEKVDRSRLEVIVRPFA